MRIRKKYLFYVLAITSAMIGAVVTTIDTFISVMYVKDPWMLCLSMFVAGLLITFFICLLLSIPIRGKSIGSKFDPSFKKIRLLRKEELKYHLIAGIGNAIATISYFYIISLYRDPSTTLAFFQVVILYLLLIESIAEKNAPTMAEAQSSIMVAFGAVIASLSLKGEINLIGLFIVFIILNPAWVVFSIYQRKLKIMRINSSYNDAINIRMWNLVFTTIFTSLFVFIIRREHIFLFFQAFKHIEWLFLSMGVTFFSYILYIRALGIGKASVTQAVRASIIIFSIPFSIILSKIIPITIFEAPLHALIKTMGVILVIFGVISFALTEVKAYIFINISPGYSIKEIMKAIWKIKGIVRIDAIAGSYDIIAKARIRTLGKGYERIIRTLENIKGIENFKWQSILKEWEEL